MTIYGVRFEVPQVLRHLDELVLKYDGWDLGEAEIICQTSFKSLFNIFPINRFSNTGESGTGKSVTLRHLNAHLSEMPELSVRIIKRPQRGILDSYRELSELFDVPLKKNNRFSTFNALRTK